MSHLRTIIIRATRSGAVATVVVNRGVPGPTSAAENGIPAGGTPGQVLAKINATDYNASWQNPSGGGDAASIATALNAGTQDSTAADTDKLAVTHPAGGWMLLSTLWTWIEAKINALATITGAKSFTGQLSSSGSTSVADTNNVVNVATNDARYGREYVQIISTAVPAFSTAFVNGPDLVLPAGTYDFELFGFLEIVGETSGGDLNFRCSPGTDVTTAVDTRLVNIGALGTGGTTGTSFRKGTVLNLADHLGTTYATAPNNYGTVQTRGTTVLASETTLSFRVKQRVTDAVNPATLAVGSFIKFTKR